MKQTIRLYLKTIPKLGKFRDCWFYDLLHTAKGNYYASLSAFSFSNAVISFC